MTLQKNTTIHLFDKFSLVIPPKLKYYADGARGKRVLFIKDRDENFIVSFEEGAQMMGMRSDLHELPMASFQCRRENKYIHQLRVDRRPDSNFVSYAFFHIEWQDKHGNLVYLPGQMVANPDYKWSDGIEPVLLELLDGIDICDTKPSRRYPTFLRKIFTGKEGL